jgi:hypothetical protein
MDIRNQVFPVFCLPEGRFSGRTDFTEHDSPGLFGSGSAGMARNHRLRSRFWRLAPGRARSGCRHLNDWSKTGRKFTMLAKNYDEVLSRHASFVTWRRTWAHIVECRANASARR